MYKLALPSLNLHKATFHTVDLAYKVQVICKEATYTIGEHQLLRQVNLNLSEAGVTALVGPNGAGKSLTLKLIAGLIRPDTGSIAFPGLDKPRIAFVFQKPVLLRRTVMGNLKHALSVAGVPRSRREERAQELLSMAQLTELADHPARKLSGGEQQRLALVRGLACDPHLLLLDEPSASLDPKATAHLESLITQASSRGVKVVLVSHDMGQVRRIANEVVFVRAGKTSPAQSVDAFFNQPATPDAQAYLQGCLLL